MALNKETVALTQKRQRSLLIMHLDLEAGARRCNRADQMKRCITMQPESGHVAIAIKVIKLTNIGAGLSRKSRQHLVCRHCTRLEASLYRRCDVNICQQPLALLARGFL